MFKEELTKIVNYLYKKKKNKGKCDRSKKYLIIKIIILYSEQVKKLLALY